MIMRRCIPLILIILWSCSSLDPFVYETQILHHADKVEYFKNLDEWDVKGPENWGSTWPGTMMVFTPDNIQTGDFLVIYNRKKDTCGLSYSGEKVCRKFTSGMVESKYEIGRGTRLVCKSSVFVNQGQNAAFWVMRETNDSIYFEIDIFEKFGDSKGAREYAATVHYGHPGDRHMFQRRMKSQVFVGQWMFSELRWDCDGNILIYYNGKKVLKYHDGNIPHPAGKIIFNTTVQGPVGLLPSAFFVDWLAIEKLDCSIDE